MENYESIIIDCTCDELDNIINNLIKKPKSPKTTYIHSSIFNLCLYRDDYIDALDILFKYMPNEFQVKLNINISFNDYLLPISDILFLFELDDVIVKIINNYNKFNKTDIHDILINVYNIHKLLNEDVIREFITVDFLTEIISNSLHKNVKNILYILDLNPNLNMTTLINNILLFEDDSHDLSYIIEHIIHNYNINYSEIGNVKYLEDYLFIHFYNHPNFNSNIHILDELLSIYDNTQYNKVLYLLNNGYTFYKLETYITKVYDIFDILLSKYNGDLNTSLFKFIYKNKPELLKVIIIWLFNKFPDHYKYIFHILGNKTNMQINPQLIEYDKLKSYKIIKKLNIDNLYYCRTIANWKFNMIYLCYNTNYVYTLLI
jgi:hypothetical protein